MKSVGKRSKDMMEKIFLRSIVRKREEMSHRAIEGGTSPFIMDRPTESSNISRRKGRRQLLGTAPAAEY